MPYSSPLFDKTIRRSLEVFKPALVLDIGAGAGKYGEIVKEINPDIKTIAIEIEKDYINKFDLGSIYTEVWNMNVNDLFDYKYLDKKFDVVIIGDIIEHLKKSEGVDLLNFLIYRSKWIIVEFPHKYLQNAVDGYVSEAHVSAWSASDFQGFDCTGMYIKEGQRLIFLKGYLEGDIEIKDLEKELKDHV